jgi:SAM-dependent methyltransferase
MAIKQNPTPDFLWRHLRDLPYFRSMVRAVEAEFYQNYDLASPVLDVGAGDGHFASVAFAHPLDVGIDPWDGPIREAKTHGGYKSLVRGDGGKMPFPDNYFGSAVSNSVLEHIPHVDQVLAETCRVLKTGALFLFCVPNPRYYSELSIAGTLNRVGLKGMGKAYTDWFGKISRVAHCDDPDVWGKRLKSAGFELERWWHYFSPEAMRAMEWGHYFGLPALIAKKLTGRWILSRSRWSLALTERYARRYARAEEDPKGVFTFYVARKCS